MSPHHELKEQDIKIRDKDMPPEIPGLYVRRGEKQVIFLDHKLGQADRRSILAEELWHARLSHSGDYTTCSCRLEEDIRRCKQEREARTRAADELIPDEKILPYLNIEVPLSVVAEELWVSEELVAIKIESMKLRGKWIREEHTLAY